MDRDQERPGFFRAFSEKTLRSLTDLEWSDFCAASDDGQRVNFIYQLPQVTSVALRPAFSGKDLQKANDYKQQAATAFQKSNYSQAAELYGKAAQFAPANADGVSEMAAVCIANRSASLQRQRKYQQCLMDIQVAINLKYPDHLMYKLLERQARCLVSLQQLTAALKCYERVLLSLEHSQLDKMQRERWRSTAQQMIVAIKKNKKSDAELKPFSWLPEVPALTDGINEKYPAVSSKVKFTSSPLEGRYAVCARQLEVGDVIVVEKSFASVLRPELSDSHCLHCHIRLHQSVPCSQCSTALFCSWTCREMALASHHRIECAIHQLLVDSGMSVTCWLALRIVTRSRLNRLLEHTENSNEIDGVYSSDHYANIEGLVSHSEKRTQQHLFATALMAVFMLRCLEMQRYFDEKEEVVDHTTRVIIGAKLMRHIHMIGYNAHEVSELRMRAHQRVSGSCNEFVAAAVFPTLALFNHSCEPAIVRYFSGSTVVARAIRRVRPGELLAENYGPIFTQQEYNERRQYLLERYQFECRCTACLEKWPLFSYMTNDTLKFKCQKCSAGLAISTQLIMSPLISCGSCGRENNIMKTLKILQDSEDTFRAATKDIDTGELERGMDLMTSTLTRLDLCLYAPQRDMYLCQQAIRKVMLTFGNRYVQSHLCYEPDDP